MRFGFVSTYPPTLCGLATFTHSLHRELVGARGDGAVVQLSDLLQPLPPGVIGQLRTDRGASAGSAARWLDDVDVAILQHEYGVYGGADGDQILDLLAGLTVPSIVVLHTVLASPTPHQRRVLEDVVRLAGASVTMTSAAHDLLARGYDVDMRKVTVIPHGAPTQAQASPSVAGARPTILSWGLIGPGKGIEWGIEAIAGLGDLLPRPRYVVAGATHPKVLEHTGEAYRRGLQTRIARLGLDDDVTLLGHYLTDAELAKLVQSAAVVLLPYDSTEQVTSGVLIEAVAACKPVVSTDFPHAVELLAGGAGRLVPHADPAAMAAALRDVLVNAEVATAMSRAASSQASELLWPAVADRYRALAANLAKTRLAA